MFGGGGKPFGFVAGGSSGGEPDVQSAAGSASVGVFSTLNHWTQTSSVLDLGINTEIVVLFEVTGHANNQCIWGCGDATHGWFLIHGTTNNLQLFLRGAGGTSWVLSTNLFLGYHCLALARTATGAIRCSLDGAADFELVASPTYTANLSTAKQFIGYDTGEANFAAVNTRVLACAVLATGGSSAEREDYSDAVNEVDRYRLTDSLRASASLLSELHFDRDWDGSASTVTAGLGATPYTFAKVGTGGGKNTIAPELRYSIKQDWVHDNGYWIELVTGIRRHSLFARTRFVTDATRMIVDCYSENPGAVTALIQQQDVGVKSGGTNQTGNSTGGLDLDTFNKLRAVDITLPAGSAKQIELIDGYQGILAGVVKGIYPQFIRVPATTPITPVIVTAPSRRAIIVCASESSLVADASGQTSPTYQCWPILARVNIAASANANWTGTQVSVEGWGAKTWFEIAGDSTKRAAFVAQVTPMLDGSAGTHANRLIFVLGIEDFKNNTIASMGAFETAVGALLDALNSALPSLEIIIVTPTTVKNETTNNVSGWNLVNLRTSLGTVQGTRTGFCALVNGSAFVSLANRNADSTNEWLFEIAGHAEYEAAFKTAMGY